MNYPISCKHCDYKEDWNITLTEYEKAIKGKCPKCKKKSLYQDYSRRTATPVIYKGSGWTGAGKGFKGKGYYKSGSQEDLDDALRENDYIQEKSKKDDNFKRQEESIASGF